MTLRSNASDMTTAFGSLGCLLAFFLERLSMSNFLRSLFGSKKSPSKIKPRMQSRRLELLGLEERVTPAVVSNATGIVTVTLGVGESITNLNAAYNASNQLVINTIGVCPILDQ